MSRRLGATLIEVLVAVFVGSAILLAATQIVRYTSVLFTRIRAHALAQSGGHLAVTRFAEEIRNAEPHLLGISASPIVGAGSDNIPVEINFRPKDTHGASLAPAYTAASYYVIYYWDETKSEWLRGQWTWQLGTTTLPGPLPRTDGLETHNHLGSADIQAILQGAIGTPNGLDFPPVVLAHNVTAVSVNPSQWPGAPYDLTQGVALSLTIHYDYNNDGAPAGLQQVESSFTKTFVTYAFPRNHE